MHPAQLSFTTESCTDVHRSRIAEILRLWGPRAKKHRAHRAKFEPKNKRSLAVFADCMSNENSDGVKCCLFWIFSVWIAMLDFRFPNLPEFIAILINFFKLLVCFLIWILILKGISSFLIIFFALCWTRHKITRTNHGDIHWITNVS